MIWSIIVVIGWILIAIKSIQDVQRHNRIIEYNMIQIGKNQKKKQYVFVPEKESKMKCQYCGKPISKEEYENERYGYCDECSDDLATEEEEDVWGI